METHVGCIYLSTISICFQMLLLMRPTFIWLTIHFSLRHSSPTFVYLLFVFASYELLRLMSLRYSMICLKQLNYLLAMVVLEELNIWPKVIKKLEISSLCKNSKFDSRHKKGKNINSALCQGLGSKVYNFLINNWKSSTLPA
nr:uncharacterized protein LOC104091551 isoform X2 [Nicotiana tomentosiformis]XP_033510800.1 uncharacterized protein LOC104091551 isoform X2 [Nicotiana tomentosiformis]